MIEEYKFTNELWVHSGQGAWYFLTLPKDIAQQIRFICDRVPGFGTVRVKAVIGKSEWKTSLFPDNRSGSFLLPVKHEIRKKAGISAGERVTVKLFLDL